MDELKAIVKERDEALLSLDKEKIERYMKKYGVPIPQSEIVFWALVHKAIIHIASAPPEQKRQSAAWLKEHGLPSGYKDVN